MARCHTCGEEFKVNGVGCEWRQGRCPNRLPMINSQSFVFCNLLQRIKQLFKGRIK